MKILMPYKVQNGVSIHDKVISGGIEKFCKSLMELFPEITPFEISEADRQQNKTKSLIAAELRRKKYDILFLNYDELIYDNYFWNTFGIPTICIVHSPIIRHIRYMKFGANINRFMETRGHVYFVSDNQYDFFTKTTKRMGNPIKSKTGLITPSFCTGNEIPNQNIKYDAITIGRSDSMKNPFWIHNKLHKTDLTTCVITNRDSSLKGDVHHDYIWKNEDWCYPQTTLRGISHTETMMELSQAGCYISTCPYESWGITVMEALSHGVPCVLMTTSTNPKHSSAEIPALPEHIKILSKKCSTEELVETINNFKKLSFADRMNISALTKQKHSRENFKNRFDQIFENRLADKHKTQLDLLFGE